jgi:hypothetical protein
LAAVTAHYVLSHNDLNEGSFLVLVFFFVIKYSAQFVSKRLDIDCKKKAPCTLLYFVLCGFCVGIPEDGLSTGRNM